MSSQLTHPSGRAVAYRGPSQWPLSVEAYHALGELSLIPEKTELLYGLVYPKMPKSPLHSALLEFILDELLRLVPQGFRVRQEHPITCADSEPEPDLAVVRGKREDFIHAHSTTAELVIEICVSSHDYDREKLPAYATAGVKEVWLVLGPEKQVEVFCRPEGGRYTDQRLLTVGSVLTSSALPSVSLSLEALFQIAG